MNLRSRKYLGVIVLLFCYKMAFLQTYSFEQFSITEGLPQSQVYALTQDAEGYLWVGTQGGGIAKFDGADFETFNEFKGLTSDFIFSALAANDHQLWVGTSRGLNRIEDNECRFFPFYDQEKRTVHSIEQADGRLYVGTNKGLFELITGKDSLSRISGAPAFLETALVNTVKWIDGQLWVGTNKGLWLKSGMQFKAVEKIPKFDIQSLVQDSEGRLWLAAFEGGLICYDPKKQLIVSKWNSTEISRPLALCFNNKKELWIGTQNDGVFVLDTSEGSIDQISPTAGLSDKSVQSIVKDCWDNLWIGTSGGGLFKRNHQRFRHYNTSERGLGGKAVYSIAKYQQQIALAVSPDQIGTFDGNIFGKLDLDSLQIDQKIKSICYDSEGRLWIATDGKGLFSIWDTITVKYNQANDRLADDFIVQATIDQEDNVWLATKHKGLICLEKDTSDQYTSIQYQGKEGIPDTYINSVVCDSTGKIWFATRNGKIGAISKDRSVKIYGIKYGLPSASIKTIAVDRQGRCFAAITGMGVYMPIPQNEETVYKKIEIPEKSLSGIIYSMSFDQASNLWMGTQNGVYQMIFDDQGLPSDLHYFGREDGFEGIENCHNAILADAQGTVWFGTMNGLMQYRPNNVTERIQPPLLHLQQVKLFYKPLLLPDTLDAAAGNAFNLKYTQNSLSFSFKGIHLDHPQKIKYRYQLVGADEGWSPWSEEDQVSYARLKPDQYSFKVQASIDEQALSEARTLNFEILSPFWQKMWFKASAVALLFLLLLLFFWGRINAIKRKASKQRQELELQNRLLSLEQKALQLQMNPHFLFNVLNSIQSLVVRHQPDEARKQIQQFATLIRSVLYNSREKTITLQKEIDTLKSYLQLEQFCQNNPFTFEVQVAEDIATEEIEIPSMLLQPFVENAVIHGVANLQQAGHISVDFSLQGEVLHCTLSDNGIGRAKSKELAFAHKKGHISIGMEVTTQRLQAIANSKVDRPMEIQDLFDEEGNAIGTKVRIQIPVTTSF